MNDIGTTLSPSQWESLGRLVPLLFSLADNREDPEFKVNFLSEVEKVCSIKHELKRSSGHTVTRDTKIAFAKALFLYNLLDCEAIEYRATMTSPSLDAYRRISLPSYLNLSNLCLSQKDSIMLEEWSEECREILDETRKVVRGIQELYSLDTKTDIALLVEALFGSCPIPSESFECFATDYLISIACDFDQEGALTDKELFCSLSKEEQQSIMTFHQRQTTFSWVRYTNFPSYGIVSKPSSELLSAIVNSSGLPERKVAKIIAESVNYIQLAKVEYLLLHDSGGHLPDRFNPQIRRDFDVISTLSSMITIDKVICLNGRLTTMRVLLMSPVGVQEVLEGFRVLAYENLSIMMTNVICEHGAVAREVTSSLVGQHPDAVPPSTSIIPDKISKFDFEGSDLADAFEQIVAIVEEINQWAAAYETVPLVKEKALSISKLYHEEFNPRGPFRETDCFSKAIANLTLLQNTLESIFQSDEAIAHPQVKLFATLFVTSYCSGDMFHRFWSVDNVLANEFLPFWNLLLETYS